MRGEQINSPKSHPSVLGSPPLARGTEYYAKIESGEEGITPACAGNSLYVCFISMPVWDHPRLRGEQTLWIVRSKRELGSPPLARGTDNKAVEKVMKSRITPACAGNSFNFSI